MAIHSLLSRSPDQPPGPREAAARCRRHVGLMALPEWDLRGLGVARMSRREARSEARSGLSVWSRISLRSCGLRAAARGRRHAGLMASPDCRGGTRANSKEKPG